MKVMNYINETTRIVYSIQSIRQANPNISIPDGAGLRDIGYERVYPALTTPITTGSEVLVSKPPEKVDGVWREVFAVEMAPVLVPQQITRAQGKAALIMQGLWGAVLDYVASIQDPIQRALAEVALNDTLTWERSSPFLNAATAGLGMTDEQLDALFIQAAGIAL